MDIIERLRKANAGITRRDPELSGELESIRKPTGLETLEGLALPAEAYETIVRRTGRPVLAIQNEELNLAMLTTADVQSQVWRKRLTQAAAVVNPAIRSVGRVEVVGHELSWLGRAWLV